MRKPLERDIQHAIIQYLELKKFVVVKVNNGGVYVKARDTYMKSRQPGVSDILACEPRTGRFWAIEVKRPSGKLSTEQKAFLERVEASGGKAMVAYSLDDAIRVVEIKLK